MTVKRFGGGAQIQASQMEFEMTQVPEFSIVVPTYNRVDLLKQAIASVQAQTFTNYELIVVDDGSSDGTASYTESLSGQAKILRQQNKGPSAARNLGVSHASGNYIAFLDSDDLWFPWTLATYYKAIKKYEPSILRAGFIEFRGDLPRVQQGPLSAEWFADYFETAPLDLPLSSNMLTIKRSAFIQVGGFDESLRVAEDHDFYLRAGTSPGFVSISSPVTLAYRRLPGSLSTCEDAAFASSTVILGREFAGQYAGGKNKEKNRRQLISRMLRFVALACLNAGLRREAWLLYWRSFWMNFQLCRFQFLGGFPVYDAFVSLTGRRKNSLAK